MGLELMSLGLMRLRVRGEGLGLVGWNVAALFGRDYSLTINI